MWLDLSTLFILTMWFLAEAMPRGWKNCLPVAGQEIMRTHFSEDFVSGIVPVMMSCPNETFRNLVSDSSGAERYAIVLFSPLLDSLELKG